ncbi:MAG: glycosyltransferase family 4 protein [Candidatus Dormibacteria bacterium]|jgi:glycosyltransferase involved in cell wall biosynthesis
MVLTERGAVSSGGGTRQASGRRVLIVCPEAPSPPTWGFALRVHHLALQLAKRNRVSMLTYGTPDDGRDWDGLERMLDGVHRVPPPAAQRARRRQQLASLGGRASFHLGALRSEAMQRELDSLLAHGGFDIVQVESSQLMCLEFHGTTPVVLDEHNIEYQLLGRVAGIESSAVRRLFGRLEAAKVEREEQRAWSVADGCVATSSVDEAVIRTARPEMPTAVVPNAVDTDYFHPSPAPADPEGIVFVASLSYRPNTDAVAWFTDQVLPRVRRARPGAVLTVVGKGPPTWLRRLEGPGVVVTGAVDDVRPFLERASVVVAPLRVGSGTRLKVLEGLSMAKAVVSTTLGAEGLDVADGEHLLLADDPAELADTILRVMADPALAGRLGAAGRALVLERYGWASAAARLEAFHAEVAGVEVGGGPWR